MSIKYPQEAACILADGLHDKLISDGKPTCLLKGAKAIFDTRRPMKDRVGWYCEIVVGDYRIGSSVDYVYYGTTPDKEDKLFQKYFSKRVRELT